MSSYLANVAEDVRTLLEAESWSENVQPTREWVHFEDMENQRGILRLAVVPLQLPVERATRRSQFKDAIVDVIVQERPLQFGNKRIDQLAYLIEQLLAYFEGFVGRKLANVPAQLLTLPVFPGDTFLSQDRLANHREFASVIRTTWRSLSEP